MKQVPVVKVTVTAFCIVINIVGTYIALILRLPIYLDSIGTILNSALLGPVFGMAAACLSSIINGITSDVYSLYFMPAGMITGLVAGFLFKTSWFKKYKLPLGVLFLTVPGTFVSSCISAFVFGGVTSSGSSIFVQFFHHLGLNLVVSSFIVQIMTDYLDRFIAVVIVSILISRLSSRMKVLLKRGNLHGTV